MSLAEVPVRENIVLVGFMGSGKSSIGRSMAKRLGFQFLDTDQLVVERSGSTIPRIFAERGEEAFRTLETEAIESLRHFSRCIIATGGGAVVRERNRRLLRELGFVVCLTASEEVIYERVTRNTKRPLLQTENPRETLHELLATRRVLYEEAAQFSLDTTELSQPAAAELIMEEARRAFSWHPCRMKEQLAALAAEIGFAACRVARCETPAHVREFGEWLDAGENGEMAWMERNRDRRSDPQRSCRARGSIILLAMSYWQGAARRIAGPGCSRGADRPLCVG